MCPTRLRLNSPKSFIREVLSLRRLRRQPGKADLRACSAGWGWVGIPLDVVYTECLTPGPTGRFAFRRAPHEFTSGRRDVRSRPGRPRLALEPALGECRPGRAGQARGHQARGGRAVG